MSAIRIPFAAVSGILFSLAVFLGLAQLVSVPFDVGDPVLARTITFTRQIVATPEENKRDPKIEREPPVVTPITPLPGRIPVSVDPTGGYRPPAMGIIGRPKGALAVGTDRDVLPLVRVSPDYPPGAVARNIEGWVRVQFTITATGSVRDAIVVASEPGTVFDAAALKAIARWRYNPRVDSGIPVERVGMQTVIRFELEE